MVLQRDIQLEYMQKTGWLGRRLDKRRLKSSWLTLASTARVKRVESAGRRFAHVAFVGVTDVTVAVSAPCHTQSQQPHALVQLHFSLVISQRYARSCVQNLQKYNFIWFCNIMHCHFAGRDTVSSTLLLFNLMLPLTIMLCYVWATVIRNIITNFTL